MRKIIFASLLVFCVFNVSAQDAEVARVGKMQYQQCIPCHGVNGEGRKDLLTPAIAGIPAWYTARQLRNWKEKIRGYHAQDLGSYRMRPMANTIREERIDPVSQYIESLPVAENPVTLEGNLQNGQAYYATCAACHGATGGGNETLNSPPLAILDDWYMLIQLNSFKNQYRGNPNIDAIGSTMVGMASILPDEQAMIDTILYIKSLNK